MVAAGSDGLTIGPTREGPAAAFGGPAATPTDAMIVLGVAHIGDKQKARNAIEKIAAKLQMSTQGRGAGHCGKTASIISDHIRLTIAMVNNKPVYTIHELLEGKIVEPKMLYVAGGPAALAPFISRNLGILTRSRAILRYPTPWAWRWRELPRRSPLWLIRKKASWSSVKRGL